MNDPNVFTVFIAAMITAIFTGLGALPFLFIKNIDNHHLGIANALAAGLMVGASIGLVIEGTSLHVGRTIIGMGIGLLLIVATRRFLKEQDDMHIGKLEGADALTVITIMLIMTVHSFAEGVGVGVGWGDGQTLGSLITAAIAIHNIPEGLAISLIVIPRGASVWRAAWYSVFSSLPQPLMAVPAFLFVLAFKPFLPVGLGLAAGAMFYMVYSELLPDALEEAPRNEVYPVAAASIIGMLAFQLLLS